MQNTISNGDNRDNRPGSAAAQADPSKPATTAHGGAVNTAATPTQTTAQKPPENATEQAKGGTGRTSAPEASTGAETVKERKRVDPIALAEEKLKQKEARLAEKRNSLTQRKRKARNGQLYVWGAMVEAAYAQGSDADRGTVRVWAKKYLTEARHVERSDFGLFRLDKERESAKREQS